MPLLTSKSAGISPKYRLRGNKEEINGVKEGGRWKCSVVSGDKSSLWASYDLHSITLAAAGGGGVGAVETFHKAA